MAFEDNGLKKDVASLEAVAEKYRERLDSILYRQLTPDNIESFAESALGDVIKLTEEIHSNSSLEHSDDGPITKQQEDALCEQLGLPNLQDVLGSIIEVQDQINDLKQHIQTHTEHTDDVLTPPDPEQGGIRSDGGEAYREKKLVPRLLTLMYLLERDLEIPKEEVSMVEGSVAPDMVRNVPYVRVDVPDLERTVYVCDERGNASYIFDTTKLQALSISIEDIDLARKAERSSLIQEHPGVGVRIIQTSRWKDNISESLTESLPDIASEVAVYQEQLEQGPQERMSEFERKEWPPYEDFQAEVQAAYPGDGGVQRWYKEEQKKRQNWPSNPHKAYKDRGWIGYSELVGREKTSFLPFDRFCAEVQAAYPGDIGVSTWYPEEQKRHPDWPALPNRVYKDDGWEGYPELVDAENRLKREWPSFEDFQAEVQEAYPGGEGVYYWYQREHKNHPYWPPHPDRIYKNTGWVGFPELVGVENRLKKEWPSYEDFQSEVQAAYPGGAGIQRWYQEEHKNHPNWPSHPDEIYKNTGWVGYSELAGVEEREWLSFKEFQAAVKVAYPGGVGVVRWYQEEQKKHEDWPSSPNRIYADEWEDWPSLVA